MARASETPQDAQDPSDDPDGRDTRVTGTGRESALDKSREPREEHRTPPRYRDWASI